MNDSKVSTEEERVFAIGGGHREPKGTAARTIEQVDSTVAGASRGLNVFRPYCQRKSALEIVSGQDRSSLGACTLRDSNVRVGRHVGVLEVRLNHPSPFDVRVDQVVNLRVVEI